MLGPEWQIINEIRAYVDACGGDYHRWWVGISEQPKARLFGDHRVRESGDRWIFRTARDSNSARAIEKFLIEKLGTDGGPGGGNDLCTAIYAFKKNPHTDPAGPQKRIVVRLQKQIGEVAN